MNENLCSILGGGGEKYDMKNYMNDKQTTIQLKISYFVI